MPAERHPSPTALDCTGDKIRTKQSFKKECDINVIMDRYRKTGIMTESAISKRQLNFGDVSMATDFHESQNQLIEAQKAFNTLSSKIRTRFNNSPADLLDFMANEENKTEAIELGIIPKPEEPEPPTETPPEPPPPPPETPAV